MNAFTNDTSLFTTRILDRLQKLFEALLYLSVALRFVISSLINRLQQLFLCIYFNQNSWVVMNNRLFFSIWFTTIASHPRLKSLNVCLLYVTWVGHKTHDIWIQLKHIIILNFKFSVDRAVIKRQPKVWFQLIEEVNAFFLLLSCFCANGL